MYSVKFKIDPDKLTKMLWGDNYYDSTAKCFTTEDTGVDGKKLQRCFVQFIMDPIIKLMKACMENNYEAVNKMMSHLIKLTQEEKTLQGKHLAKAVFMKWLNAGESLMEMIVTKLPSPV